MAASSVRLLLADDFEPFRRFVKSLAREHGSLLIAGEASDGWEAVRKAEALQPDLILLDIGLPRLNGIEAARKIHQVCPNCKILFLSQHTSIDVVRAALATGGARGYVVKADSGSELLIAINAVMRGEQFVGSRFSSQVLNAAPVRQRATLTRHEVFFYSDHVRLLNEFSHFVGAALKAGDAVVVVATEWYRNSLSLLHAADSQIGTAIEQGRYIAFGAAETLQTLMVNDRPDPVSFVKAVGDLITTAAKAVKGKHPRVAVYGECAPLLCAQGNQEAAIGVERLWNGLGKTHDLDIVCDVDLLCGYPVGSFHGEHGSQVVQRICAEHTSARLSDGF